MLDWVPKFVMGVVPVVAVGANEDSVLTGTGISVPEAIMAFLLLLVKTIGREMTLNFPVESSAFTIAARPKPVLRKTLVPPPGTTPAASFVMSVSVLGSRIGTLVFRDVPATPVFFGVLNMRPLSSVWGTLPVAL